MATHALEMSGNAVSRHTSERPELDAAVATLRASAPAFARLPAREKAGLFRRCMPLVAKLARAWVEKGCQAKGIALDQSADEWLPGPFPTLRMLRMCAETLEAIAIHQKPPLGTGHRVRSDGRLEITVLPTSLVDRVSFTGFSAHVLMQEGVDLAEARRRQASFYSQQNPQGGVSLILGAGNVSSIPPMDVFSKMCSEGRVCLLKMNPVNEWVGPILEEALEPLIARDYLRIVYGGADVGKTLTEHAGIDDIHITGSDRTHDLIVWGPPGAERQRRKRDNDPLLKKPITSELGNVSPVAIVPARYSARQLWFQAQNVASMVTNNGSFNCNAAKMLITGKGWAQRDEFFALLGKCFAAAPTRDAYYPGAHERYKLLVGQREVQTFGSPTDKQLPWTFIPNVDANDEDELLFSTEPFCGILSATELGAGDPATFVRTAAEFMNDQLWGTLNAAYIVEPSVEKQIAAELDRAIVELRYGTVGLNHWPAAGYIATSTPWGGHPSSTLANVQSGLGWVHNTFLIEGIDKSVIRGPIYQWPKPAWFYDNTKTPALGPLLIDLELNPSLGKVPRLLKTAIF